jgi:peptidoglycan/xylan/chitin deacetylase (PgdA/CDA1 family)
VREGQHVAEGLRQVTQVIQYDLEVIGEGNVVSLARTGSPGEQEIFKGVSSGKQAAIFVVRQAQNALLQRTDTVEPGQKLAALTFDDGPGVHTQEVVDALAAKHVPATFFMQGSSAAVNKALVEEIRMAGHEIENHSWNHPDLTTLTEAEIRSQIAKTNSAIGGCRYLRPPYGSSNDTVKRIAASLGMRLAFWTVDTLDWQHQDVDWILSRIEAGVKPGAIILMHDGGANRLQTVAAIPVVVDWLFAHGYSITTVDHILR